MSGVSVDVSQVSELVDNTGYPVLMESYEAAPLVYPSLGSIVDPADLASPFYGEKGSVLEGMERFRERQDGQDIERSTFDTAYTWYQKCSQFARSITIPSRLLRSSDNLGKIGSLVTKAAAEWGEIARLQKEDHIAGMFQKGTLTAGSRQYFDGSFPGNVDPNPTTIYDGLPWYDTAHTLTGSAGTYANHIVSAALSAATLQSALIAMTDTNAVNERGERILIRPDVLMVPPGLEYTARVVLNSGLLPGGSNNDINAVEGALQLVVNRALSDAASASSWWIVQSGKGLRIADSGAPRMRTVEHTNGDIEVIAEYEFGAAVTNWRYHYCANKAAS
jgi:phage major head subunit gpT-like protein